MKYVDAIIDAALERSAIFTQYVATLKELSDEMRNFGHALINLTTVVNMHSVTLERMKELIGYDGDVDDDEGMIDGTGEEPEDVKPN